MYSQHGEDLRLVEHFSGRRKGTFLEVGAFDGVYLSNTCLLEREYDWHGVLIEPNPRQAGQAVLERPNSIVIEAAAVAPNQTGQVELSVLQDCEVQSALGLTPYFLTRFKDRSGVPPVKRLLVRAAALDRLLEECGIEDLDLVTIDVEGHEDDVLRGFSLGSRWNPGVVLIERCSALPSYFCVRYFWRAGYRYATRVAINDWYEPGTVRERIVGLLALALHCIPACARSITRTALRRVGLLHKVRRWRRSFTLRRMQAKTDA